MDSEPHLEPDQPDQPDWGKPVPVAPGRMKRQADDNALLNDKHLCYDPSDRRDALRRLVFGLGAVCGGASLVSALGMALTTLTARTAGADPALDVQILQTASSIEIATLAVYDGALAVPSVRANSLLGPFAQLTKTQHEDHARAFQQQTAALGGQVQSAAGPKYGPAVESAKPNLRGLREVVALATTLEEVATHTYLSNLAMLANPEAKTLMAKVVGVEAQHLAILRVIASLLDGGTPELVKFPLGPDVARLPGSVGTVAFPEALPGTGQASPPDEGAVR